MFNKIYQKVKEFKVFGALTLYTVLTPGLGALLLIATSHLWLEPFTQLGSFKTLLFFSLSCILAGASFIPTHAVSLIAGILFGPLLGPTLALSSVSAAALFGYTIMSRLIGPRLISLLSKKPRAKNIHYQLLKQNPNKTTFFIILLRLSPIMPFAATNLILAGCKTHLVPYLIGSIIGLAPRVIIVALAGVGLNQLDLSQGTDQRIAIIGFISTLLILAFITKIVKASIKHSNLS